MICESPIHQPTARCWRRFPTGLLRLALTFGNWFVRFAIRRPTSFQQPPMPTNGSDDRQFSRSRLRRLRSDVLLDSIIKATEWRRTFRDFPQGTKAIEFYPRTPGDTSQPLWRDDFLKLFGRSSRNTICSCETKGEATLSQTLHMAVGDNVHQALSSGLIDRLLASDSKPAGIINELFMRCLSRSPSAEELAAMQALVGEQTKSKQPYQDILWALINSTEFITNH